MVIPSYYVIILLAIFTAPSFLAFPSSSKKSTGVTEKELLVALENAAQLIQRYELDMAEKQLRTILDLFPTNYEALQLYGTYILQSGKDPHLAVSYFEESLQHSVDVKQRSHIFINYIEALRQDRQYSKAIQAGEELLKSSLESNMAPHDIGSLHLNIGMIYSEYGNGQKGYDLFKRCLQFDNHNEGCWTRLLEVLVRSHSYMEAEKEGWLGVATVPKSCLVHYYLGIALHFQKKVDDALALYLRAEQLDPKNLAVKSNIAAALQVLGRIEEAESAYRSLVPLMPNDAGLLNNFGALLGIQGKREEEVYWLQKALELDPYMEQAIVNMAGYYQDEGLLDDAKDYLERFAALPGVNKDMLRLRLATMLSPVSVSWPQMVNERTAIVKRMVSMLNSVQSFSKTDLDPSYDRIHFYLCYHGLNDRYIQELVVEGYSRLVNEIGLVAPELSNSPVQLFLQQEQRSNVDLTKAISTTSKGIIRIMGLPGHQNTTPTTTISKKRIGFCSKFFGIFEPHGMLLDGVMKYLPRDQFVVVCLAIARTDGKPLASTVAESCDEIHDISLVFQHAVEHIFKLKLDTLIFADLVSEPMNHFLSQVRFAPIQMAFWGNPITSGSSTIDYFISAEIMEHPFRTRMMQSDEPYSEQVLLTEGQGIWYFRPVEPEVELAKVNLTGRVGKPIPYTRRDFEFLDDWFIYLLPQSVFKIHPLYDYVLAEILRRNPTSHLVITGGRRPLWTEIYTDRLRSVFGRETFNERVHLIERVSSENFYNLLQISDVILHPFPFDGSRTSADALMVGKPFVTLPTEYLRGRMGVTYLRTMNIPELAAVDIEAYISIAIKLAHDKIFYDTIVRKIRDRLDLIWEDMMFPYSITVILQRVLGIAVLSSSGDGANADGFIKFLKGSGRNVEEDLKRSFERQRNSQEFDRVFGKQLWQLNNAGRAQLETIIDDPNQWPLIFEHWKRTSLYVKSFPAHPLHGYVTNATLRGFNITKRVESSMGSGSTRQTTKNPNPMDLNSVAQSSRPSIGAATLPDEITSAEKAIEFNLPTGLKLSVRSGAVTAPSLNRNDTKELSSISGIPHTDSHILPSIPGDVVVKDPQIQQFHKLVRQRKFSEALVLAQQIFVKYQYDAMFLMELGVLQFFRGEYQEAFTLCQQSVKLSKLPTIEMMVCLGVSATYLPHQSQSAIDAFLEAHKMMLPAVTDPNTGYIDRKFIPVNSFFSINIETIESNLIASFESALRFDECIEVAEVMYEIPMTTLLGAYTVAFSTVDWSKKSVHHLNSIDQRVKKSMKHSIHTEAGKQNLVDLIMRFRVHGQASLNHIIPCYTQSKLYRDMFVEASKSLLQMIALLEQDRYWLASSLENSDFIVKNNNIFPASWEISRSNNDRNIETTTAGVTLITQFFDSSEKLSLPEAARRTLQEDLNTVLMRNLMNPYILEICMLLEKDFDFSKFPNNFKIKKYILGKRMTFRDTFLFARDYVPGRTVVVANADIYLDTSVRRLFSLSGKPLLPHNMMLALLKWIEIDGVLSIPIRTDSQDIWIFRSPLGGNYSQSEDMNALIDEGSDFFLGLPRCDNRIAYLFSETVQAKGLNMSVSNPVFHIHGIEIQRTSRPAGSLYGMKGAVQGQGKNILIAETLPF